MVTKSSQCSKSTSRLIVFSSHLSNSCKLNIFIVKIKKIKSIKTFYKRTAHWSIVDLNDAIKKLKFVSNSQNCRMKWKTWKKAVEKQEKGVLAYANQIVCRNSEWWNSRNLKLWFQEIYTNDMEWQIKCVWMTINKQFYCCE